MFRGHKEKKKNQNGGFSYMLASFIIHKRGWIESVFVIGCLLSLLTMNFVNVNYDLTKYLPETAESAIGLDVMRDKFGYPGTARVMVKDVSLYEAKQYKDEIADIDGVDQVLWCDSTVNIYAGEDFIDESEIKDYYKDRNAVYDITFVEESDSTRTSTAIDEIKDLFRGQRMLRRHGGPEQIHDRVHGKRDEQDPRCGGDHDLRCAFRDDNGMDGTDIIPVGYGRRCPA